MLESLLSESDAAGPLDAMRTLLDSVAFNALKAH